MERVEEEISEISEDMFYAVDELPYSSLAISAPFQNNAEKNLTPEIPNSEILSAFECQICTEYMLPPYLQCPSGHLVCGNCRPKLTSCPACRGPVPNVRNLILEKIVESVKFPCKFSCHGCPTTLLHNEKLNHEKSCEFKDPFTCPSLDATCNWKGSLETIMKHLTQSHNSIAIILGSGEDVVFSANGITSPIAVDWVMVQCCYGFSFMFFLERREICDGCQMFYAIVQLIGSKKNAQMFSYRLELLGDCRRLSWESKPRSLTEGVSQAIDVCDCLTFNVETAELFAQNGNLEIRVVVTPVA